MAKTGNQGKVNYLKINKDGKLYRQAKDTDAEKNIVEVVTKEGVKYNHILFTGSEDGYLDYLGIVKKSYESGEVPELTMVIKGENETDSISVPMYRADKGLNGYVKHMACVLPNMDFSERVSIVPSTKKDDRNYTKQSIFINYVDKDNEIVQLAHKYGEKNDIPMSEKVKALDGTLKSDFKKQDKYLYDILIKEIERFTEFKSNNATPKASEKAVVTKPVAKAEVSNNSVTDDDLPF